MKTFVMTTATSSLVLLLFALYTMSFPMYADDVVEKTCRRTPNYNLCASILRKDPRSSGADVRGLALIVVGVVEGKAKEALSNVKDLIKSIHKGDEKLRPLNFCAQYYEAIITADVPQATEALKTGNYKFAEQSTNDAANEADSCERSFSRNPPLTEMNKLVHDVAAVAEAMTRILLSS